MNWIHCQSQGKHCYFLHGERQVREQPLPQRPGLLGARLQLQWKQEGQRAHVPWWRVRDQ